MKIISTKEKILMVSLDLFSIKGYEATSVSQIADAVGIKKASLYSHFESKQDILDSLFETLIKKYDEESLFAKMNWDDCDNYAQFRSITPEAISEMIKEHVSFIIHQPEICKARKLLTIEQFNNPNAARLYSKQSYEDIIRFCTGLMKYLIEKGHLSDDNADIMAAQFAWPISLWINLCDREPEREEEVMELIDRHVKQFFRVYRKNS